MSDEALAVPGDPVLVVTENEIALSVPDEESNTIEIPAEATTIVVPRGD